MGIRDPVTRFLFHTLCWRGYTLQRADFKMYSLLAAHQKLANVEGSIKRQQIRPTFQSRELCPHISYKFLLAKSKWMVSSS